MKYRNPYIQDIARKIQFFCAILFVMISFMDLYELQRYVLAQLRFEMTDGTSSHPHYYFVAIFCTMLLTFVGLIASKLLSWLPIRGKALAWFPSFLLLGTLTMSFSYVSVALLIILYLLVLFLCYQFRDAPKENNVASLYFFINLLIISAFALMSLNMSDVGRSRYHVTRYNQMIAEGRQLDVLEMATTIVNPTLSETAMVNYSLMVEGQLPDRMFQYPQHYGSEGLFPAIQDTVLMLDMPLQLGHHIGYIKGDNIPATRFLELANRLPNAKEATHEYLLCAYLLDKNLNAFVRQLSAPDTITIDMPTHYREALALYHRIHPQSEIVFADESMTQNLEDFLAIKRGEGTAEERTLMCQEMYGNTYWYYYFFGKY